MNAPHFRQNAFCALFKYVRTTKKFYAHGPKSLGADVRNCAFALKKPGLEIRI